MAEKPLMTIVDFANYIGIGIRSMYKISKIEGFPQVKVGRKKILVPVERASEWIATHDIDITE